MQLMQLLMIISRAFPKCICVRVCACVCVCVRVCVCVCLNEGHAVPLTMLPPHAQVHPSLFCRKNALTAHLISPASGASFSMFMAHMKAGAEAAPAPAGSVERWVEGYWQRA